TYASDNGNQSYGNNGCISAGNVTVQLIDANGVEDPNNIIFPCFEHSTLGDLLDNAGVTWKYYATGASGIWTAPASIDQLCPASGGVCTGTTWSTHVDIKSADVLTDIANCNLPQVAWINPHGLDSDHANMTDGTGPSWVASIVNAIGNSWANSNQKCDYW